MPLIQNTQNNKQPPVLAMLGTLSKHLLVEIEKVIIFTPTSGRFPLMTGFEVNQIFPILQTRHNPHEGVQQPITTLILDAMNNP